MEITLSLPRGVTSDSAPDTIIMAVRSGCDPLPSSTPEKKQKVFFSATDKKLLSAFFGDGTATPDQSKIDLLSGYARAGLALQKTNQATKRNPAKIEFDRQKEQDMVIAKLAKTAKAGSITLWEMATGFGKSRIFCRHALHLAREEEGQVYLTVPTISILAHFCREFSKVERGYQPGILLGKQNFVSLIRLNRVLKELEAEEGSEGIIKKAQKWIDGGGKPTLPHTKAFAKIEEKLCFFTDDLAKVCPEIPSESYRLIESIPEEPSFAGIESLSATAKDAEIVLCSHVMYGLISIYNKSDEIEPRHLLVDEAHLFEENIANLMSSNLSLFHLRSWLKSNPFPGASADVDNVNKLMDWLRKNYPAGEWINSSDPNRQAIRDFLNPILNTLSTRANRKRTKRSEEEEEFYSTLKFIYSDEGERASAYLDFSPVYKYPRLTYGPKSIKRTMEGIWDRCLSAVLLSGTLATPTKDGGFHYGYMQRVLGIPEERKFHSLPIIPPWLYNAQVGIPSLHDAKSLSYPSEDAISKETSHEYQRWITAVCEKFINEFESGKGGALVLVCSHRDRIHITKELAASKIGQCLIPTEGLSSEVIISNFITLAQQGGRPVWIGTGAAWTGIDLTDPDAPPEKDFVLTDLFLTRMPFNLSQSSTQTFRQTRNGMDRIEDAIFRFRQGVGRLIRREGIRYRRIFLLDGRIVDPDNKKNWHSRVLSLLSKYRSTTI